MATAGSIVVDLLMRTGAFETDSKRAEKRLQELQKTAKQVGTVIGTAMSAATVALAGLTYQAIQSADELDELSQRLQISTEQLSKWEYAAKLSGSSLDGLARGLGLLSRNLAAAAQDGSRQEGLFKSIGVEAKDAEGNLRDVEDVLPEIADAFQALDNQTLETALAMELFGKTGAELLEFLNRGSEGITELGDELSDLGGVIDGETAAAAAEFNDQLDKLKVQTSALGLAVARDLLPDLIDLVESMSEFAKEGGAAAEIAGVIGAGFDVLGGAITVVSSTVRGITFDLIALGNAGQAAWSALTGDWKGAARNIREAQAAREMAAGESADVARAFGAGGAGPAAALQPVFAGEGAEPAGLFAMSAGEAAARARAKELEDRLNAFLADPTGKGGKTGGGRTSKPQKSDAEREAERLQEAYEGLMGTVNERIALFGKEGEAAAVRYETELGSLAKLDPALKQQLVDAYERLDLMNEEAELARKLADEDDRRIQRFTDMMEAIAAETGLLGMSADQQEVWNNLKWAGVTAESEWGKAIIATTEELQRQREAMDDQIEAMDVVRDSTKGLFKDLMDGSKSAKEAFGDFVDNILSGIADIVAENLAASLFGQQGDPGGGGWGEALGSIFGSFFGGSKAGGGDALANRAFWVGEQGPELFVPRTNGTVLTAGQSLDVANGARGGGRLSQQNNIYVQGRMTRQTEERLAQLTGREAQRALARNGR